MIKTVSHDGVTCIFDSKDHTYKVSGQKLISVTQLKSKYFPEFETLKIAKGYAQRNGYEVEDVLHKWKVLGEKGAAKGNAIHKYCECILEGKDVELSSEFVQYQVALDIVLSQLKKVWQLVGTEFIVFSKDLQLAGQIDLLMRKDDIVYIVDWKTDKQINNKNNWGRKALPPIEYLDDCNFHQHTVQLNLYEHLLRTEKYFDDVIFFKRIIHVMPGKCIRYRVPTIDVSEVLKK